MRTNDYFDMDTKKNHVKKNLRQVMVISLCSVLLCVSCFVGTTWAWFTVSIANEGNIIQIDDPEVTLNVVRSEDSGAAVIDDDTFRSGNELVAGEYMLTITRRTNSDDLNQDMKFYASLIISYLDGEENITKIYKVLVTDSVSATIKINTDFQLRMEISWLEPANAEPVIDNLIEVQVEEETEPTEESTEPTESTTESTEPTTAPTEGTTESTEPTTAPTEGTTESTEPTTAPTEGTTESTEPTTAPTEGTTESTEPTESTTKPTVPESGSQENATKPTDGENNSKEETPAEGSGADSGETEE